MQTIPLTETDIQIVQTSLHRLKRRYYMLFAVIILLFAGVWLWLRSDLGLAANAIGLVLLCILTVAIALTVYLQLMPIISDLRKGVKYIAEGRITEVYSTAGNKQQQGGHFFVAFQPFDLDVPVKWLQLSPRYGDLLSRGQIVTLTWLPHSKQALTASFTDEYIMEMHGGNPDAPV